MKPIVQDHREEGAPAPWGYVVATDPGMSGWGGAENRVSRVAWAAESEAHAAFLASRAWARGDMRYVRIVRKLRLRGAIHLSIYTGDWMWLPIGPHTGTDRWIVVRITRAEQVDVGFVPTDYASACILASKVTAGRGDRVRVREVPG